MNKNLRDTIDRMVEDAIRKVLPGIMNEVLLQTIANSGVIQERAPIQQQQRQTSKPQQPQVRQPSRRPSSLNQLLDPEAGADFYADPRAAMNDAQRVEERPAPRQSGMAQMIQSLPPELRDLAEDVNLDDDGGEMWDDSSHDSGILSESGPSLERAAQVAGLDFSVMKRLSNIKETKNVKSNDASAKHQFEEMRIKRMREQLNGGKPVE